MRRRTERMNAGFVKHHLGSDPWPFHPVFHHFTAPDRGDPHDHPWSFTTHILTGGYVEEVFHVAEDGSWRSETIARPPGTAHRVASTHIHRIVALPEGECWTLVLAGPAERETRFWRFGEVARSRLWNRRWPAVRTRLPRRAHRQGSLDL